jgi:hypothetical protein
MYLINFRLCLLKAFLGSLVLWVALGTSCTFFQIP